MTPTALPNYVRKLHQLWRTGALPRDAGLRLIEVLHDDWCRVWQGQRCNCDPDIKLKAGAPERHEEEP
jgi:hypothetical protein